MPPEEPSESVGSASESALSGGSEETHARRGCSTASGRRRLERVERKLTSAEFALGDSALSAGWCRSSTLCAYHPSQRSTASGTAVALGLPSGAR